MKKETSKQNIIKAQDSRRLIGVRRFLEKLIQYKQNAGLWKSITELFRQNGINIEE